MANRNTKTSFFKPNVPKKVSNLTWKQAKARFPGLNPYGDIDKDRVKNFRDCKPFDIKRQGENHKRRDFEDIAVGFDTIKRLKTVGDVQKLEESMLRREEEDDE